MTRTKPAAHAKQGSPVKRASPAAPRSANRAPSEVVIAPTTQSAVIPRILIPLLMIGAALAAYHNSFQGTFQFDDVRLIVNNWRIRQLWPLSDSFSDTSRPISRLSLAVNYAAGGLIPWGYHAFNLAVHVLAGLLLFGIVRRTLDGENPRADHARAAPWTAGAVAAVWMIHPLQTESVTYIIQRDESLMGLFFLLTLYCGMRACRSPHPHRWSAAAIAACALGMGTKEVMVSAPVLMLLYDRVFVAGSFKDALRLRWRLYAGLSATWLVLAALLVRRGQRWLTELGANVEVLSAWQYALTQPGVIVHYLRLSLWPDPLVFDYSWPLATTMTSVAPWAAVVLALLVGTFVALRRWPRLGFLGAWFFIILAPTSSIMPIADAAVEHRLYLPLAAVVAAVVVGAHDLLVFVFRRVGASQNARAWVEVGLSGALLVTLGIATIHRNDDYRSEIALWSDTVTKRPDNPRAHNNLGVALAARGRTGEALAHYAEASRLKPDYAEARHNLGRALIKQGRTEEAIAQFSEAIRLKPGLAGAHVDLGLALAKQGKLSEAIAHYREALRLKPDAAAAHNALGSALAREGNLEGAIAQYAEALRLDPTDAEAENNLGAALHRNGKVGEAIAHLARAIQLNPSYAVAHNNLGIVLGREGKIEDAAGHFAEAVRLDPGYSEARDNLRKTKALLAGSPAGADSGAFRSRGAAALE